MATQPQDVSWSSFDNSNADDKGLDVWGFLMRRKAFIILLALVGAGAGYLYAQRQTRRYSSTALLQVIHSTTDPRVENYLAERSLADAQFVITSRKLLEPCYDELVKPPVPGDKPKPTLDPQGTLIGLDKETALTRIAGMLSANSHAANILHLSCEGDNPIDTAAIANVVAVEYIEHQQTNYQDALTKLQTLLSEANDKLLESLTDLEKEYAEFVDGSSLGSDGENPHQTQLDLIQQKINTLVIRQTEVKAELSALTEARNNGGQKEALMLLVGKQTDGQTGDSPADVETAVSNARTMTQALFPLMMEESILSEQVGPGHPKLIALRKRIELTRGHFVELAGIKAEPGEEGKEEEPQDFLDLYLNSLEQELSMLKRTITEFEALATDEETEARKLRTDEHERARIQRQMSRETSLLEDIQKQIRNTELPTNIGGVTASILSDATPGILVYPKLSQFIGLGAFLGGFVGLLLGYVVEAADRSFRKPEELIREFGIPILGHVPYIQEQKLRKIPKDTTIDRTVISLHLPRSRPSEAYRSVRTAVCFSALGSSQRVIQVTSPAAGDGKSTLAMNFAVSLAQSGRKTVIVESDFRRPKVHRLTGVNNDVGVVDVLRGNADVADAVKSTELEGFFVMPCGSRPRNPSELLTRPEYEQLLTVLREKFDYVIIDTPPVLVVTDPCSVAPRVDGVLLCVRLSRHTREFGRRALEQLRDVGANMSGIVVNGVEESDAYGYGNYSYSDYRYRYKDSYNAYGDKQNDAYFVESESEPVPKPKQKPKQKPKETSPQS